MTIAPDLSEFSKEEIKETLDEIRHPFEVAVFSSENYFNMGAIIRAGHSFCVGNTGWLILISFIKRLLWVPTSGSIQKR